MKARRNKTVSQQCVYYETVEKSQYFSETEYFISCFASWDSSFFDIFQFFEILCRDYFQSGEICVYVCSEYSVKSTGYYAGV